MMFKTAVMERLLEICTEQIDSEFTRHGMSAKIDYFGD